jgi:predicted O-linked N-acetylglucosamine transferase (SPINDLY family)
MTTVQEALAVAWRYHDAGRMEEAKRICQQILQVAPGHAEAAHLLGLVAYQEGNRPLAAEYLQRAIALDGRQPHYHNNLGEVYRGLGKIPEAAACYRRALELKPGYAEAHSNLGNALAAQGDFDGAIACYRRSIELQPALAEAHYNLGNALALQGRLDEAAASFQRAAELGPGAAEVYNNLGAVWKVQGKLDEAAECFERALQWRPGAAEIYSNLGGVWLEKGMYGEAIACYQRALAATPTNQLRYESAIVLPVVYQSSEQLEAARSRLVQEVQALARDGLRLDCTRDQVATPFYLAYQGKNDRDILGTIGRLWFDPRPGRGARPHGEPGDGRIRVGFVSAYFCNHTIGWLWRGLMGGLSRKKFRVTVFSLGRCDDCTARAIRQSVEHFVELPRAAEAAQERIEAERLDVLYYTDVGMDRITSMLAACRLAPVQCATWGHPTTTGLPSIDYFLSSELLEIDAAEQHYTEKLVRLKTLGLYLYRPELAPPAKGRADFGLPEDKHLYACLQSAFKLHPDFDGILGNLLRRDPKGEVLLLEPRVANWRRLLEDRFARTIPDVVDRVRFVPRQPSEDFLRLNTLVDVSLDPIYFGGGRTSCEAFSLGLPVVTLPSTLLRGRITYALYRILEMMDCVAGTPEEYVELAVRLGTQPAYRAELSRRLLERSRRLFEDRAAVREVEGFLEESTPSFPS